MTRLLLTYIATLLAIGVLDAMLKTYGATDYKDLVAKATAAMRPQRKEPVLSQPPVSLASRRASASVLRLSV